MIQANTTILDNLNAPLRKIDGKVELLTSSTLTAIGTDNLVINDAEKVDLTLTRKNLFTTGYYNTCYYANYNKVDSNSIIVTKNITVNGQGWANFKIYFDVGKYQIKADTTASDGMKCGWALWQGGNIVKNAASAGVVNSNFEITTAGEYLIYFYTNYFAASGAVYTFSNIQIEKGDTKTDFTPYIDDFSSINITFTGDEGIEPIVAQPTVEGVIEGVIPPSANTTITSDTPGVIIKADYIVFDLTPYTHEDAIKSIKVERIGENKFFGFGICQKSTIGLLDKERAIDIGIGEQYRIYFCDIQSTPIFYVSDVVRNENTNDLNITAYDAIHSASSHTVAELNLTSYTIGEFAEACSEFLGMSGIEIIGVPEENNPFALEFAEGANFNGSENIRTALNAIAEATQTLYYVNANNKLVFKRLDIQGEILLDINKDKYFTLESKGDKKLTSICSATELGDNLSATTGENGETQYIRNNPFWDLREDRATLIDNALVSIGGLTLNQFNCKWRGNFLIEIGDKISLTTKDDNIVVSYLLNDTMEYTGGYKQTTSWNYDSNEGETFSNPTTLGEIVKDTYAKVDKANQQIEMVASKADANEQAISTLQINTEGINASVMKTINDDIAELKRQASLAISEEDVKITIESELSDGVSKVSTSTGFTFDDEGLVVNKANSEMKTTITEDGMTVYKNDEAVLVADNEGVKAEDLHATTYLIVGNRSRFEDYESNGGYRTGCFWIGG